MCDANTKFRAPTMGLSGTLYLASWAQSGTSSLCPSDGHTSGLVRSLKVIPHTTHKNVSVCIDKDMALEDTQTS